MCSQSVQNRHQEVSVKQGDKISIMPHGENPKHDDIKMASENVKKILTFHLEGEKVVGSMDPGTFIENGEIYQFCLRGKVFGKETRGVWPVSYCPRKEGSGAIHFTSFA